MAFKWAGAFLAVPALLAPGGVLSAAEPHTTRELRALSARAADRQLRSDLLSVLRPSGKYPTGMRRLVGDQWVHTKAYGTRYKGLCQRDTVSVHYAPTEETVTDEDAVVRPYGVTSDHGYYFVRTPKSETLEQAQDSDEWRSPFQPECAKADGEEWVGWFDAPDEDMAMEGGIAFLAALDWAREPEHQFSGCSKRNDGQPFGCREDILPQLKFEYINDLNRCEGSKDEICWKIEASSIELTIKAKRTGKPLRSADISDIKAEYMIIVT